MDFRQAIGPGIIKAIISRQVDNHRAGREGGDKGRRRTVRQSEDHGVDSPRRDIVCSERFEGEVGGNLRRHFGHRPPGPFARAGEDQLEIIAVRDQTQEFPSGMAARADQADPPDAHCGASRVGGRAKAVSTTPATLEAPQ